MGVGGKHLTSKQQLTTRKRRRCGNFIAKTMIGFTFTISDTLGHLQSTLKKISDCSREDSLLAFKEKTSIGVRLPKAKCTEHDR